MIDPRSDWLASDAVMFQNPELIILLDNTSLPFASATYLYQYARSPTFILLTFLSIASIALRVSYKCHLLRSQPIQWCPPRLQPRHPRRPQDSQRVEISFFVRRRRSGLGDGRERPPDVMRNFLCMSLILALDSEWLARECRHFGERFEGRDPSYCLSGGLLER